MKPPAELKPSRVAALLFASGFCALVYQTAWLRELRLVFGASTFASAAVLAIFMGGMGVGAAYLGKRVDAARSPLMWYGNLELVVAGSAALTPLLISGVRALYLALGGSASLGLFGATAVRLALAALVLLVPTVAMGGTLPAAARAIERAEDADRRRVGILYGVNALGAVVGASATTLALFVIYGVHRTLWLAAIINAIAGLAARIMAKRHGSSAPEARPAPAAAAPAPPGSGFALVAAGVVGFAFFLLELVWYRMLAPILGGSAFTFGLILAVALAGIGAGGAAWALGRRRAPSLGAFAFTCALEALFVALPLVLGDRVAILASLLRALSSLGFMGLVSGWVVVAGIVVFPASLVAGYQFPLLISLLGKGGEQVGSHVGRAYASNTLGSILGSLAGGFGLLPALGAVTCWRLCALLLIGLAAVAAVLALRAREGRLPLVQCGVACALAIASAAAGGPTAAWRNSPIGAGRSPLVYRTPSQLEEWRRYRQTITLWEADGRESAVALLADDGLSFYVNGKSDGHALLDSPTQVMGGVLGALLHPDPKKAFVIGLGTGSSAGWLAALPGIERVDTVEIEPAIVHVAQACGAVNLGVLENPKVHLIDGDAREVLAVTRERYDVVFSEPSNPYRAGVASLFTREFYEAVRARLSDQGILVQWLQGYEISPFAFRSALATIADVFPDVQLWRTGNADLLLVAQVRAAPMDAAALRERMRQPGYREALRDTWRVDELEGVLSRYVAGAGLAKRIHAHDSGLVNTDDASLLEFAFARTVGASVGSFSVYEVEELAARLGADRPQISGEVSWELAALRRREFRAQETGDAAPGDPKAPQPEHVKLVLAMLHDEPASAPVVADGEGLARLSPLLLPLAAESAALHGDPIAESLIARLDEQGYATEARLVAARWHFKQGRSQQAADALADAFVRLRSDPWVPLPLVGWSLQLATALCQRAPDSSGQILNALSRPFAVESMRLERIRTRVQIARRAGAFGDCTAALHELEPHPWMVQDMLEARAQCYGATGDELAQGASSLLADYLEERGMPLEAGLVEPGRPSTAADGPP